jgi:hypothetical protein
MNKVNTLSLFGLGQIVATPGALLALEKAGQSPGEFLARHHSGDWGELEEEDRQENARSLEHGFRLLSAYKTVAREKLWVITEADRSVTTNDYWAKNTRIPAIQRSSVASWARLFHIPVLSASNF